MIFKEIVKAEMAKQGITPTELIKRTGIARSTVNNFLSDKAKSPSMETGGPIAKALGISLDEIYDIEVPGMDAHEINRIREGHEALKIEYADLVNRSVQQSRDDANYIEQMEKENQDLKLHASRLAGLYHLANDRNKWQRAFIIILAILALLLGLHALRMDAMVPDAGFIRY